MAWVMNSRIWDEDYPYALDVYQQNSVAQNRLAAFVMLIRYGIDIDLMAPFMAEFWLRQSDRQNHGPLPGIYHAIRRVFPMRAVIQKTSARQVRSEIQRCTLRLPGVVRVKFPHGPPHFVVCLGPPSSVDFDAGDGEDGEILYLDPLYGVVASHTERVAGALRRQWQRYDTRINSFGLAGTNGTIDAGIFLR